jgi:hypothetical protein
MATVTPTRNVSKTGFVKEFLNVHPQANTRAVNEAWASAGNEGGISGSLIYKIRAKEGLTGNEEGQRPGRREERTGPVVAGGTRAERTPEPVVGTPKPADRRTNRGRVIEEVEGDIDRLIFKLMGAGGMEQIEDALRVVRRRLYGALSAGR